MLKEDDLQAIRDQAGEIKRLTRDIEMLKRRHFMALTEEKRSGFEQNIKNNTIEITERSREITRTIEGEQMNELQDQKWQFIRDLTSVNFYNKRIIEINLELEAVAVKLYGISAMRYDKEIGGSHADKGFPYPLLLEEEKLIDTRQKAIDRIMEVEPILEKFTPEIKEGLIKMYLLNEKHEQVAADLVMSRGGLRGRIDREFKEIIKKAAG